MKIVLTLTDIAEDEMSTDLTAQANGVNDDAEKSIATFYALMIIKGIEQYSERLGASVQEIKVQ
jgi:hypothetical protein